MYLYILGFCCSRKATKKRATSDARAQYKVQEQEMMMQVCFFMSNVSFFVFLYYFSSWVYLKIRFRMHQAVLNKVKGQNFKVAKETTLTVSLFKNFELTLHSGLDQYQKYIQNSLLSHLASQIHFYITGAIMYILQKLLATLPGSLVRKLEHPNWGIW